MSEAKHPRGLLMNRAELAHCIGIARTTVDAWVLAGMPVYKSAEGRGKSTQFDTSAVIDWVRSNRCTCRKMSIYW